MLIAEDWDFLTVNGYGTLGVAYQGDEKVLLRNSLHTNKGTRGDVSLANYTNLGLQLTAQATDDLTFTLQGILSENNSNAKVIELGWANAKYQVTDGFSIKAGVMRIPTFLHSDILTVSYSYEWVKLPEMYILIPFHNYTGVELSYDYNFDNVFLQTTIMNGKSKGIMVDRTEMETDLEVERLKGVNFKLQYENLMLRLAYIRNKLTAQDNNINALSAQIEALNHPLILQTLNKYMPDEVDYFQVGGEYEFENMYLTAEYMKTSSKSFLANNKSWYVGTGYLFDNWSPYLLFSRTRSSSNYKDIPINANMSQQELTSIVTANQIFDMLATINSIHSETRSIGFRYTLNENAVLKFQYDRQKELSSENVGFNYGDPKENELDVYSASISFVF